VTGGSSGIGRTSAIVFVREGAKVVVADVNIEDGEETVHIIKEMGGDAFFVKTDVSKAVEVDAVVNKTVEIYGRLDWLQQRCGQRCTPRCHGSYT